MDKIQQLFWLYPDFLTGLVKSFNLNKNAFH